MSSLTSVFFYIRSDLLAGESIVISLSLLIFQQTSVYVCVLLELIIEQTTVHISMMQQGQDCSQAC